MLSFCRLALVLFDKMQIASTFCFRSDSCTLSHNVFVVVDAAFVSDWFVGNDVWRSKQTLYDNEMKNTRKENGKLILRDKINAHTFRTD